MLSGLGRDHGHAPGALLGDASRQELVALDLHGTPRGGSGQYIRDLPALGEDGQVVGPRAYPIDETRLAIRQWDSDSDPGRREAAAHEEGLGRMAPVDGQSLDPSTDQLAAEGTAVELAVLETRIAHRLGEQIGIEYREGDAARLGAGQCSRWSDGRIEDTGPRPASAWKRRTRSR
jgi:hypothetical protein